MNNSGGKIAQRKIACMGEFLTRSPEETKVQGARLAAALPIGSVVALIGELGSGKTTLVQGMAQEMGITEPVGSPTFKIVSEYDGNSGKLYHVDCYRLEGPEEFIAIGGEELLNPTDGITVIEWAEKIEDLLPDDTVRVHFSRNPGRLTERVIKINGRES
jgi:tRNA threonylcarbamoyladenosine biosynthesis protein TsaE